MKVSDLQQHLADLARLLESSNAKAVAADLVAIRDGLAPFREQPLKGFADFLLRAEAYSRGEVPLTPPAGKRAAGVGAKSKTSGRPPQDAEAMGREIQQLYERAAHASVTREEIEAATARLGPLKKDEIVGVSEKIGMAGMKAKSKDKIQEAIRERILARKGATQRAGLIDRPDAVPMNGPRTPTTGPTNE